LPCPEDFGTLTADDAAHRIPRQAGALDDLLDRHAIAKHSHDSSIGLLPALVPFILQALRGSQESGINDCGADNGADLTHGFANRLQKGTAGILHQMPAIGDLLCGGQRFCRCFAISAAAVASDDGYRRMAPQPRLGCRRLPVGQERHGPSPFEVADDRAVPVIAPPCEVVDADHGQRLRRHLRFAPNHAQQRIVADRDHQPLGKARRRTTAKRQAKVMHDQFQSPCPARHRSQHILAKSLGEDATAAEHGIAPEAPNQNFELDPPACNREVRGPTRVVALDAFRADPARRTRARRR